MSLRIAVLVLLAPIGTAAIAQGQQLLDRVMARVGTEAVTMIDVQAAVGLGLVDAADATVVDDEALQRVIERRLALTEVNRVPRNEPDAAAIDAEVRRMKAHAGERLAVLLASTGLNEDRLVAIARDTLRIRSYLATRFPSVPVSDADAEEYFRAHPEQFRRNGTAVTFAEGAAQARAAVSEERRSLRIAQWLNNLRERAEISIPARAKQP